MKATLLKKERIRLSDDSFVEVSVWKTPEPVPGSSHCYKYSLAYIVHGICSLRYDNETGKGDHRHVGMEEKPYKFSSLERLVDDFWSDVAQLGE